MVTMIDEIFDRNYQHGRAALNAAIATSLKQLSQSVGEAFLALNRIEYSAPWAAPRRRARIS